MKINKKRLKNITVLFLIVGFLTVSVYSPYNVGAVDEDDIKDELKSTQKELDKNLKKETILNSEYNQVVVQVGTTKNRIAQTASEIARKEAEIKNLRDQVELYKKILASYLQEMYFNDQDPVMKLAIANDTLDNIFGNTEQMLNVKEKVLAILDEINASQAKLGEVKEELADKKEEHEKLLQQQKAEQNEIAGDIQETKATIAELQKKLAGLQSDLAVLTGKSYNAKDIREAMEYANKKTGVPEGILFAFLTQESGRGKNTGQCTYDNMEDKAVAAYKKYKKLHGSPYGRWNYNTSISTLTTRKGLFESLVKKLGYSKDKKVSCAIIPADFSRYEPNQGGAMGVAQFMSDTWFNSGLQSQVRAFTGHAIPDPWSLTDGTMALAIKVRDAGGTSTSSSAIKKMVTKYYGASPDTSSVAKNYYNNVLYYVKNYKTLFP